LSIVRWFVWDGGWPGSARTATTTIPDSGQYTTDTNNRGWTSDETRTEGRVAARIPVGQTEDRAEHVLGIDRGSFDHLSCGSVAVEGRWPPLSHPGFPRVEARRWGVDVRCLKLGRVRRLKDLPPPFE